MGDTILPREGEEWEKPSFPVPTIVRIKRVDNGMLTVTAPRRWWRVSTEQFLAQGFTRRSHGEG